MSIVPEDPKTDNARALRQVRLTLDLSQEEMAEALGIENRATYANYEIGRVNPPLGIMQKAVSLARTSGLGNMTLDAAAMATESIHTQAAASFRRDIRDMHADTVREITEGSAGAKEHAINLAMDSVRQVMQEVECVAANNPDPIRFFLALCRLKGSAYEGAQIVRALMMSEGQK